jgi:hypothetical protein
MHPRDLIANDGLPIDTRDKAIQDQIVIGQDGMGGDRNLTAAF